MTYLPGRVPFPSPSADTEGFWDNLQSGKLVFQGCVDCANITHPPLPVCSKCQSKNRSWVLAPKVGYIFTYTVVYHAGHDSVREVLPYNVVVVEFRELQGVRIVSNVVDVPPEGITIGMAVEAVFESAGNGRSVVRFRRHS